VSSRGKSLFKLYALVAAMVFFWSVNYVVAKIALREFSAVMLACMRTTFAGLFVWPMYLYYRGKGEDRPSWSWTDIATLIGLAVCGVSLNQLCFVLGLSRTSVAHSSILNALCPVLVLLLASAAGHEHITWKKLLGLAVAVAGIAALNLARSSSGTASLLGDCLTFLAALSFAFFTVLSTRINARLGGVKLTIYAYLAGALVMAPITVWESMRFDFAKVSAGGWLCVVYMALFSSVVCYLIFYYLLARIPASRVTAFSYVQPLIATLVAVPILGESINGSVATGGALVLAGVFLTERG
jgi:drug/metabolite transporter (DMT)-like permease